MSKDFLYCRWENEANHRYYELYLDKDLFGWCLTKVWGRKGTNLGRVVHQPCQDYSDGKILALSIDKLRKRRGYCLVNNSSES